jgi:hypothetical protein
LLCLPERNDAPIKNQSATWGQQGEQRKRKGSDMRQCFSSRACFHRRAAQASLGTLGYYESLARVFEQRASTVMQPPVIPWAPSCLASVAGGEKRVAKSLDDSLRSCGYSIRRENIDTTPGHVDLMCKSHP